MDLADVILQQPVDGPFVCGIITDDSPLTGAVGPSTTPVQLVYLDSYTPTIGDHVLIVRVAAGYVVLGKTAGP